MHIAIWLLAALALGFWSLLCWGVAALLGLEPGWVTSAGGLLEKLPYRELIEAWVPGWQALLLTVFEATRALLSWLGGFGHVLVWIVWAAGAGLVLLCAALLSGLVALVRRSSAPPRPANPGSGARA